MNSYLLGKNLVNLEVKLNFPLAISLQIAASSKMPVSLLGLLVGMSEGGYNKASMLPVIEAWKTSFQPTANETLALKAMASSGEAETDKKDS